MKKFHERIVEGALLAITVLAGVLLFCSVAWGIAETPGCFNNKCIWISYYYDCPTQVGKSYEVVSCLPCYFGGRCVNGSAVACSQTINPQGLQAVAVTPQCDCNKAPLNGSVQASGNYSGPWNSSGSNQWLCGP